MTQPLWRQAYDAVEQRVAPQAEAVVRSEPFADLVGLAAGVERRLRHEVARTTRRWLHLLNLPAGTDMTRILGEVGQLRMQVRALQEQLEAKGRDGYAHDSEA